MKDKEPIWQSPMVLAATSAAIVFVGFKPLFDLTPEGISKEVLVAGIGALFVTIITLVLLKNQTDLQQKMQQEMQAERSRQEEQQKRSEQLREKKISSYSEALQSLEQIVKDQRVSAQNLNELRFAVFKLQLIGDPEAYQYYQQILESLATYYADPSFEGSEIEINEEGMRTIFDLAHKFSNRCREDEYLKLLPIEEIGSGLETSISSGRIRKELTGGIQEFVEIQGLSGEQGEQIAKVVATLEKQVGLQASYKKTQISLAGATAKQKRKNVVYLNTQKVDGIILGIADTTDESLVTDLVDKLKQHYPKTAKKFRKDQGRYSVEVRMAWQDRSDLAPLAICLQEVLQSLGLNRFDTAR